MSSLKSFLAFLICLTLMIVFLLVNCSPAPSGEMVRALIVKHFETPKYHVVDIRIGDITSLSPGEKIYMGTPGYLVDIKSITLEIRQNTGSVARYTQGQHVTFTNGRIRIKEQPGHAGKWIIADISGIPVP